MDKLYEFLYDLIFEGKRKVYKKRNLNPIIRVLLIILIFSFFISIFTGLIQMGLQELNTNMEVSLLLFVSALLVLATVIYKFKKTYEEVGEKR